MADEIVNADVVIGDVLNVTVDNVSETVTVTQTTSQEILNATIVPGTKGDPGEPGADAPSDHTLLTNIGTNTHAQIDTAISNSVSHIANTSNPHSVTKAQVGLSNVPNTDFTAAVAANTAARHTHANKTLLDTYSQTEVNLADAVAKKHTHANSAVLDATTASFTTADETKLDGIAAGAQVNTVTSVNTRTGAVTGLAEASDLTAHTGNTSNPHGVTKAQVGLGNVDNTADANKPVSTATQMALDGKFTQRTITGTANQVTVTNGDGVSGNPTLSLPQSIATTSSPTFAGLTINGTTYSTGTGFPNGVVSAPVGSIYIDTAVTNGVSSWIKKSGTGSTGWLVLEGDTGWRNIGKITGLAEDLKIRRINNIIYLSQVGEAMTINSLAYQTRLATPLGFRSTMRSGFPLTITAGDIKGSILVKSTETDIILTTNTASQSYIAVAGAQWITNDAWPTTLPGTAA
jgi:Cu/Ag efflux protein CusF/frataxin-like iron-binding protein CyaY